LNTEALAKVLAKVGFQSLASPSSPSARFRVEGKDKRQKTKDKSSLLIYRLPAAISLWPLESRNVKALAFLKVCEDKLSSYWDFKSNDQKEYKIQIFTQLY